MKYSRGPNHCRFVFHILLLDFPQSSNYSLQVRVGSHSFYLFTCDTVVKRYGHINYLRFKFWSVYLIIGVQQFYLFEIHSPILPLACFFISLFSMVLAPSISRVCSSHIFCTWSCRLLFYLYADISQPLIKYVTFYCFSLQSLRISSPRVWCTLIVMAFLCQSFAAQPWLHFLSIFSGQMVSTFTLLFRIV